MHAARALGRPVKWTDKRSEVLSLRSSRPRAGIRLRTCARQRGQFSRGALHGLRRSGRLHDADRPAVLDLQHREARELVLPHAAHRGQHAMRVHQHRAGDGLSRRRAPRGQLLHGAPDRYGGRADGHGPGGAAPQEPHPARSDPLQGAVGLDVRLRQFSRDPRQGAGSGGLERLCRAQGRERAARSPARPRNRPVSRSHRPRAGRIRRRPFRAGRLGHDPDRLARPRAGALDDIRADRGDPARRSVREDSPDADRFRPAARPARARAVRNRSCVLARRSSRRAPG